MMLMMTSALNCDDINDHVTVAWHDGTSCQSRSCCFVAALTFLIICPVILIIP